jgi:hypothetical protein
MKESSLVNDDLLRQRLTELGSIASWAPHILSGLERFIRTAGDYDLFRVNPIQYATANGLVLGGRRPLVLGCGSLLLARLRHANRRENCPLFG